MVCHLPLRLTARSATQTQWARRKRAHQVEDVHTLRVPLQQRIAQEKMTRIPRLLLHVKVEGSSIDGVARGWDGTSSTSQE